MVLSLEIQTKCNWCGKELDRRSYNQIVYYCSKVCRKLARSKKFRKKLNRTKSQVENKISEAD